MPSDPLAHRQSLFDATGEQENLFPGAVVAGRYVVERQVGGGAMGEVWLGAHVEMGLRVAIKRLLKSTEADHEVVARFRREAQVLARIRCEVVARIVDFMVDKTFGLLLVMEFIDGESLSSILNRQTLSVEEAIELASDVTRALAELHRASIAHRDVKPGNLLLEPRADGSRRAVLVDFGASRLISTPTVEEPEDALTSITQVEMTIGTLEYMAPEQIVNSKDVTAACDVYALGAILYRAVAGKHAYGPLSESKLVLAKMTEPAPALVTGRNDPIARGFEAFVAKALQRDAEQRFADGQEMADAIKPLWDWTHSVGLDDGPTDPFGEALLDMTVAPPSRRSRSRSHALVAVPAAVALEASLAAPVAPSAELAPAPALPALPAPPASRGGSLATWVLGGLGFVLLAGAAFWIALRH